MPKFFAGLYLNASIIFLLICVCVFRICKFVCSASRLGPFGANLYLMGVVLNNFASVILVSVFLLIAFHISESNKD